MATLSESLRRHFRFFDVLLFAAGLSLLFVYFMALPAQHPDSAAGTELTEEEAAELAETYVIDNGFILSSDLEEAANLARDVRLLDSLQADYGRPQTVRLLRAPAEGPLPAFYWRVDWRKESEGGDALLSVLLALDGKPLGITTDVTQVPIRRVNRSALAPVLGGADAGAEAGPLPADVGDSTLVAMLTFDVFDGAVAADSLVRDSVAAGGPRARETASPDTAAGSMGRVAGAPSLPLLAALQQRPPLAIGLNARAAAAIARHHLGGTVLGELAFEVDSVRASSRPGLSAATVYFHAGRPYYGQAVAAVVEVSATGGLLSLQPEFNPEVEPPPAPDEAVEEDEEEGFGESSISFDVSAGNVADIIAGVLYVALVLMTLFMFIRRLNARVVDTKSALRDALWAGIFVGIVILMTMAETMFNETPQVGMAFVILSVSVSIAALGGAFLVFLASGAMDSLGRAVWPDKLATLGLVRHSAFRNVPVGAALLRGVFSAFVLAGGTTLLLALLPGAGLDYGGQDRFSHTYTLSLVAYAFAKNAWLSMFLSFMVLLGVGSLVYRMKKSAGLVVSVLTVVLLLLQIPLYEIFPLGSFAVFSAFTGFVLAFTFWRYDFVTAFTSYLVFGLMWETQNGWLVPGSAVWLDALLGFLVVGVLLVTGLVGALSRRTDTELPSYMPSYIQELAQEERMKGELEIAYEVQASFLPRHMPQVAGLDVAAMCLPALEIGGDYYDFVELEQGRLAVVIGDVSGKGIQAAFYMTLVKGFFQTLCRMIDSPAEVLRRLNVLFRANAPRGTFISMIYGVLDVESRMFTFARAGHNPVILKRSPSQDPELFRPDGIGIGMASGKRFDDTIAEATIHLRPGDVLVFYTDGFSEAMNARKELYGDARLAQRVSEVGQRTASEILRAVSEDVHHFMEAAGRHDDMTMVVIKVRSRASYTPGAAVAVEHANA